MRVDHLVVSIVALAWTSAALAGEVIRDQSSGCGVWNDNPGPQESVSFRGQCDGGLANGEGTLIWYFQSVESWVYIGHFIDGKRSGQGKLVVSDGTVVEGYWKDNRISRGISVTPDGRRREGFFKNGRLSGLGRYTSEDGLVYEGNFVEGRLEGEGKVTHPDGTVVAGEFVGGILVQ